ncbi:type I restriction-modification system endonuclease [Reinekea thalattae]|uniref:Type I restriction-modification system endonuclease n=1 Tax=Reinekea thalattae TaxID=2593301 RepID=A0A5C8ZAN4_9GAMM|nr:type I restriction-modification system endonuclease [Reinekea thalattae]TXR54504.1 type I restriction-modification system endonuclease [Reinekea thalattae]
MTDTPSSNFEFLKEHDPIFFQLTHNAEKIFAIDPNACLMKLRQFGEAIAQDLASQTGLIKQQRESQLDLLNRLSHRLDIDQQILSLFHILRKEGNTANHEFTTTFKQAMDGLRAARNVAIWYHETFRRTSNKFKPGPFLLPEDPSVQLKNLEDSIQQLKGELQDKAQSFESSEELSALINQQKQENSMLAKKLEEDALVYEELLQEQDAEQAKTQAEFEDKIARLTEETERLKREKQQLAAIKNSTKRASQNLHLSEKETRQLIDEQLTAAHWQADSESLTFHKGHRPEKGKNKAIAEWPVSGGRADYVLFAGLTPIAIVEAKKENSNVSGKISQAERYSKNLKIVEPMLSAWQLAGMTIAWPDEGDSHYKVPFVYSCNGRPYVPQLAEYSGTWFRDVRESENTKRALASFHTPEGLLDLLKRSKESAQQQLQTEPFGYLKLRDYQQKAITAVEETLAKDIRKALLAMATGTGKTRTIIGLMYRFLKAERFKRILFLVDRTALGQQAIDAFNEAPLEQNNTLSKIYNIAELGDMAAEAETRVQVATVQAMVKRIFMSDNPPPLDQFDCIIIDEAHRGYTLDQEMTEGEIATRDASQYISSYRRVLDYFDAVKIALTATPAKHTSEIFGKPVYTYSYREAVADDWLIDHEPPIRYQTLLSKNGITFTKGEAVESINTQTGEIQSAELDDELTFEVEAFNRQVINENFNRVICQQLIKELDPFGDEKTMIFCATDLHADMVKRLLDEAFKEEYNGDYNQAAVAKITGQSDKVEQLIRQYKNERYPNIAITVDLLTTGIDVPPICNLVFMRRVKSRILYEQMIGRATRRCNEIGKTVFRIYDPVDIYATLADVNTMKPLVKDPNITLEQLIDEITDPEKLERATNAPGDMPEQSQADVVLSQLSQKVMRVLRKAEKKSENDPKLKQRLNELQSLWNVEPKNLHKHLNELGPKQAAAFINQHNGLLSQLEQVNNLLGNDRQPIISVHDDEIHERTQSYGNHAKPEDYLDSFNDFIKEQLNQSAALTVVVTKPRNLTREQLKEIKLLLDSAGYNEPTLQTAVREQTNQDIAASIIGHIRQAALGEPLVPFEQRIAQAMQRIYQSQRWTPNQRNWLGRLAKQLVHEIIIDRDFVNDRFSEKGGAKQLDKILNNQLDTLLEELSEAVWPSESA